MSACPTPSRSSGSISKARPSKSWRPSVTNFSLSSALKASALATLAVFAGCGPNDGAKEYDGGVAAYEVRDLKRAEKLFAECLGRNPGRTDALVMMARVRKDLGELALAKEAADKAAALSAGDPDVIALDAEIAYHAKDYARATRRFGEIAENAALSAFDRSLGWTGLGIVHQTCIADSVNDGARDLARVAFLRAIRLDRTNAAARYHLGLLYRDAYGYPAAALEQFELFVRLGDVADARVQKTQRTLIPAVKEDIARRASSLPGASKRDAGASVTALQKADAAWKKGQYKTAPTRRMYSHEHIKQENAKLGLLIKKIEELDKWFEHYKSYSSLVPAKD